MRTLNRKIYWSPKQVRVWRNGRLLDLGPRSLQSTKIVAAEMELELVLERDGRPKQIEASGIRK